MFKAILGADFHLFDSTAEELQLSLQLINDCGKTALARKISNVMVLGDVFQSRNRYSPELLLSVHQALGQWKDRGVNFILLRGNHDCYPEDPENTILNLFNRVATIINKPELIEEEDCVIFLMPWYPPTQFRKLIKHYASYAVAYTKPRIMMTHVSLQEGVVSPSNTKIDTPIRVADLIPEIWKMVLTGDFHREQMVETRKEYYVRYLGSPRPFTHGDSGNIGLFELNVTQYSAKLHPIELPSRYPKFISHRVDSIADLPLRDYDLRDKHRIYVSLALRNTVAQQYPTAKLEAVETAPELGGGRLEEVEKQSTLEVAEKWWKLKKLGPEFKTEMRKYL